MQCKTTLPPWPVLSSFNTHFFLHLMPVFSTFFYSWLMRKTVPPWPMQCKTILLPWPCEKAERGNPRFITSPSWLFPESKSPWPCPGLLLGHCTVVVKGPIFSERYWYYFHCPKNVLHSILSFVFWIFPPSDTAVQLESADSKHNTISKSLFQDSFRHIFWAMRKMHHTFWKKATFNRSLSLSWYFLKKATFDYEISFWMQQVRIF